MPSLHNQCIYYRLEQFYVTNREILVFFAQSDPMSGLLTDPADACVERFEQIVLDYFGILRFFSFHFYVEDVERGETGFFADPVSEVQNGRKFS